MFRISAFASVVLLFASLTTVSQAQTILSGPIINPSNGHTYYLLDASTWTQAQANASALGGNLVTINDAAEDDWVYSTFATFGGTQRNLWTGFYDPDPTVNATDRAQRRLEFQWISGEAITYTNWSPVEPNNPITPDPTVPELYVHIWNPSDLFAGRWNNYVDDSVEFGSPINGIVEVAPVPEPGMLTLLIALGAGSIRGCRRWWKRRA